MIESALRPGRPLDLVRTLAPLGRGPGDRSLRLGRKEAWRATRTPAGPATLHLRQAGSELLLQAWGEGAEWAVAGAPELVGEGDSLDGFHPAHPLVAELDRRHPGLRLSRSRAVWEALVPTVLEQKVIGLEARRAYFALLRATGERAPGPAELLLPPAPATIAATPYWRFHPWGVERRRAETLIRAAQVAHRLEETVSMTGPEAGARLASVRGIGPWTAGHVRLAALGDADAVPLGDYHLPHLVAWSLAGEPRGSDERMLELLAPYAGHRGRVLRLLVLGGGLPPRRGPRLPLRRLHADA